MDAIVYIDGFNFYYGQVKNTPYKWLDFGTFCQRALPGDNVIGIKYFTAPIKPRAGNKQSPQRQQTYIRALETVPNLTVHRSYFLGEKTVRMPLANPVKGGPTTVGTIETEEKENER